MHNKRNKDIYEKEADVVNFLLKSKKYKDSKNTPLPCACPPKAPMVGVPPPAPPPPPPPETSIQRREKSFDRYLRTNRIQIRGVNREDLVKDVAGAATTRLNLTAVERRTALRALALSNVPVSQIYNPTYKKEYQNIRATVRPPLTPTPSRAGTPTTSRDCPPLHRDREADFRLHQFYKLAVNQLDGNEKLFRFNRFKKIKIHSKLFSCDKHKYI